MRHRLKRRYGHAAKGSPRVVHRMPTGGLVWSLPGSKMHVIWGGPGSRLRLAFDAFKAGGSSTSIDHHTADGNYMTAKEASAAVKRFSEAK